MKRVTLTKKIEACRTKLFFYMKAMRKFKFFKKTLAMRANPSNEIFCLLRLQWRLRLRLPLAKAWPKIWANDQGPEPWLLFRAAARQQPKNQKIVCVQGRLYTSPPAISTTAMAKYEKHIPTAGRALLTTIASLHLHQSQASPFEPDD